MAFQPESREAEFKSSPYPESSPVMEAAVEPKFEYTLPVNSEAPLELAATGSPKLIDIPVAFTAQAPFGEWSDPRQQDGCEESSVLMAMSWAQGFDFDKAEAKQTIIEMAEYQEEHWGTSVDTSAFDTMDRLVKGYYKYPWAKIVYNVDLDDILLELYRGNILIMPMNGQAVGNPNFTPPGPERHMILVRGYDPGSNEFITNDPGTRKGEGYRYPADRYLAAIRDYPSGDGVAMSRKESAMIVISKAGFD